MSVKLNLKLLIKLILIEIGYFYAMLFILIFAFFFYFGSGAGASSKKAILCGEIATYFLVFSPITYNIIKVITYRRLGKIAESNSNLIAGIFISFFMLFHYYKNFI